MKKDNVGDIIQYFLIGSIFHFWKIPGNGGNRSLAVELELSVPNPESDGPNMSSNNKSEAVFFLTFLTAFVGLDKRLTEFSVKI